MNAILTIPSSRQKRQNQPTGNDGGVWLNDCHSRLNETKVADLFQPAGFEDLLHIVRVARKRKSSVIPFGGRHAMGSQQFGSDGIAVDMNGLNRVLNLENERGILEVEAGITWTGIQRYLDESRSEHSSQKNSHGWAIRQKQTGADELTIGGSLAANVHGRGLSKGPIIQDVRSFTLVNSEGDLVECSRKKNTDLFQLAIGGYGLFGLFYSVRLQLTHRKKVQRIVRSTDAGNVMGLFQKRIESGYEFGDFQFHIDNESDDFLKRGIFSCYQPVGDETEMPGGTPALKESDWMNLLYLAHTDKSRGFQCYEDHYHRTDESVYWSDSHQFTTYVDGYHEQLDKRMKSRCKGSEMISELYVPRQFLPEFLAKAREELRRKAASVIYGTVRLIETDHESFLAWAREPWACVIFNICVEHSTPGLQKAKNIFRGLIDRALEFGGSYYLTYHKFASRQQVEAAHPRFSEFLRMKNDYDPDGMFRSNWWCHHKTLFTHA